MERKWFWIVFTVLSLFAYFLPLGWGIVETLVAIPVSWWIVYRSGWI